MNILFIDDEVATINILKKHFNWDNLQADHVMYCYNAKSARKIVTENAIDIVICDIEMPQESGLHFLFWLKEEYPYIERIILTAYPDFNYANKAIDIGVYRYLLKPVSFDELSRTIRDAANNVRKQKKEKMVKFYTDLIGENILPFRQNIDYAIRNRGLQGIPLEPLTILQMHFKGDCHMEQHAGNYLFAIENVAAELFPEDIIFVNNGHELFWIVRKQWTDSEAVEKCGYFLESIRPYLRFRKFIVYSNNVQLTELSERTNALRSVTEEDISPAREIVNISEMNNEHASFGSEEDPAGEAIFKVKQYISNHLEENISRQELENLVHLNVDYLNRIFKSVTGYTLMQYVQYYRILASKRLMMEKRTVSIADIAVEVGFDTPSYFSKIFKKWVGMTPQEYLGDIERR